VSRERIYQQLVSRRISLPNEETSILIAGPLAAAGLPDCRQNSSDVPDSRQLCLQEEILKKAE
jgi:hypothetical protein